MDIGLPQNSKKKFIKSSDISSLPLLQSKLPSQLNTSKSTSKLNIAHSKIVADVNAEDKTFMAKNIADKNQKIAISD